MIGVTVDRLYSVGVFGYDAAPFVEAEHARRVAICFGTVFYLRLVDFTGEFFPNNSGQLHTYADIDLIVFYFDFI